jgi:NusA-like KH domain protein
MKTTLDITSIQQINLFSRITGVRSDNCFNYYNSIIFVVHPDFINRAIGRSGENLRRLSAFLKKKVRIIRTPDSNDLERFVSVVVYPIRFKKLTVEDGNVVINAGQQSKASLIGRDHARLNELTGIVKQYFDIKEIRIV